MMPNCSANASQIGLIARPALFIRRRRSYYPSRDTRKEAICVTTINKVRNPYTGEYDHEFLEPNGSQVKAVAQRLRKHQTTWAAKSLAERVAVLREFGQRWKTHRAEILEAIQIDTGRSHVARLETDSVPDTIERVVNEVQSVFTEPEPHSAGIAVITGWQHRVPYGLIGNITPWNFPIILSFIDTLPALAAGNAVLVKPSEVTPRWIEPVRHAISEVPELSDVLELLPGAGQTGAEVIRHVDAVSFTGSVATGRKVYESAARHFIPAFLELGGKDPVIVLESADVKFAAETVTHCSVGSTGQACQSLERAYVARPLLDKFVEEVVAVAESMTLNYPDIEAGLIGPFIFEKQPHIVMEHLRDAVEKGAVIQCGGEIIDHGGQWMRPTVLTNVRQDMKVMQEETFGPVIPIMAFDSISEAIELANDSTYGLSASVFAGSMQEGHSVAQQLKAGAVSVNDASLTAFVHDFSHDSFGFSGLGSSRFGPPAGLRFTREQAILENDSGQAVVSAVIQSS